MKSLRNKVILSGIVLLFAFIATIGSTYAWFTVSTQTSVEALELQVAASDNLLIRVKKLNDGTGGDYTFENAADQLNMDFWSTSIVNQDFLDAGYFMTGVDPWRLQPVTIIQDGYGSFNTKTLSHLDPLDTADRGLTEIVDGTDTDKYNDYSGYYIKLEMYLLSLSDDSKQVEVDKALTSITEDHDAGDDRGLIINAVRLSVFSGVNPAYVYGYDNNYGFDFTGSEEENTTAGTLSTVGFNSLSDLTAAVPSLSTSVVDIDDAGSANPDIVTLTQNTPTLITVYVFIEGWHVDAANYVVGAQFNISFGFKFEETDNDL
jgi:hypothetical protein